MKSPKYKLTTDKTHLAFIRKLPCCKCNRAPSEAFQFEGNVSLSLPMCLECIKDKLAGYYDFVDEGNARELARKLHLTSGDYYSAMMVIINDSSGVFK